MESSSDIDRLTSQTDPHTELSFSELDSMKSRIGTIWTDISSLMNKYHAQLVLKHQKLDPLSPPVNTRSDNQKSSTEQWKKCQKEVSSLQSRLLEKDSEIVKLRSEIQKFRNVLMVKDNLIEKIQNQMTQEALDYHSEITALKEMLEEKERASEGQELLQEPPVPVAITVAQSAKRRRVGANESVAPKRPTVSSLISSTPPARRASSFSTQAATSKTSVHTPGHSSRGKSPSSPRGELPSSPGGAAADMDSDDDDDDDDGVDDDFELDEAGDLSQLNLKEVKDLTEEQGNAQQPRNVKPRESKRDIVDSWLGLQPRTLTPPPVPDRYCASGMDIPCDGDSDTNCLRCKQLYEENRALRDVLAVLNAPDRTRESSGFIQPQNGVYEVGNEPTEEDEMIQLGGAASRVYIRRQDMIDVLTRATDVDGSLKGHACARRLMTKFVRNRSLWNRTISKSPRPGEIAIDQRIVDAIMNFVLETDPTATRSDLRQCLHNLITASRSKLKSNKSQTGDNVMNRKKNGARENDAADPEWIPRQPKKSISKTKVEEVKRSPDEKTPEPGPVPLALVINRQAGSGPGSKTPIFDML